MYCRTTNNKKFSVSILKIEVWLCSLVLSLPIIIYLSHRNGAFSRFYFSDILLTFNDFNSLCLWNSIFWSRYKWIKIVLKHFSKEYEWCHSALKYSATEYNYIMYYEIMNGSFPYKNYNLWYRHVKICSFPGHKI